MFRFLNRSSEERFQRVRELCTKWLSHYPESQADALRNRIRGDDDEQHLSSFFELYVHELLIRDGYGVDVEQEAGSKGKRPDFFVKGDYQTFYVECVQVWRESSEAKSRRHQLARLYDVVNQLGAQDFILSVHLTGGGPPQTPKLRQLRQQLAEWLATLDRDSIALQISIGGPLPKFPYRLGEWSAEFRAWPTSVEETSEHQDDPESLGIFVETFANLQGRSSIRMGLKKKAGRYGDLDKAYVIAINMFCQPHDDKTVLEALFGDPVWNIDPQRDQVIVTHKGNGLLNATHNTRVSGILAIAGATPSQVGYARAVYIANPWASRPLPNPFAKMSELIVARGKVKSVDGTSGFERFDLPDRWPEQRI